MKSWFFRAKCAGSDRDFFFPEEDDEVGIQAAKDFCETCPVKDLCLEYSYKHAATKKAGIYGGMTPEERQALDKKRRGK